MDSNYPPDYVSKNHRVFDRFTFDWLFKRLLADGYEHEEAKDAILNNCALSALVFQERIHNKYYLHISISDKIAPDLARLQKEIVHKVFEHPGLRHHKN